MTQQHEQEINRTTEPKATHMSPAAANWKHPKPWEGKLTYHGRQWVNQAACGGSEASQNGFQIPRAKQKFRVNLQVWSLTK
jgi:hypothetical protein